MTSSVAVLLPVYGPAVGVDTVVRDLAVAGYALRARGMDLEVILIEDGGNPAASKAAKIAVDFGLTVTTVNGVPTAGDAYVAGFRHAVEASTADLVVTLDGTGQHDAMQIPSLIDQLEAQHLDVVIGSRWSRQSGTPGLTLRRWFLAKTGNFAFRRVTGVRGLTDVTTTFRVMRVDVLRQLDLSLMPHDIHGVQMALITHAIARGCRIGEGPIVYRTPAPGVSKLGGGDIRAFAKHLWPLRRLSRKIRKQRLSPGGRQFTYFNFDAAADLEQLGTADRFFGWTLEEFKPYLKGTVLEVGAGLGTITRKLVDYQPDLSVVALEPAGNVYRDLASYAAVSPRVTAHQLTTKQYVATPDRPMFDAIIYLNVLEHIENEEEELTLALESLRPGGALLVFGPALEWLYSELDYNAGHYRRYSPRRLRDAVRKAGFEVVSNRYFDVLGVLPYYIVYRVFRRPGISGSTMWGYDRVLVPVSRLIQQALRRPPLGKNVIMVARKPLSATIPAQATATHDSSASA